MAIHLHPFRNLFRLPERADPALKAWVEGLGIRTPEPHPRADQEEWTEAAALAKAVIETGYEVVLHLTQPIRVFSMEENPDDIVRLPGASCPEILIRHGGGCLEGCAEPRDRVLSERYAELAAFETLSGRRTVLTDCIISPDPESMSGYRDAMARSGAGLSIIDGMAEFRGRSCLVKVTRPVKHTHNRLFEVPADADARSLYSMVLGKYEFDLERISGDRDNVLIQEVIPMTHETRFFVAGGEVVSGAGCIEEHTPLDREAGQGILPPVFELGRNEGERVRDEGVAERLVAFAREAAAMIVAEEPELRNFVLDAAIGPDGASVLIELNPIVGAGLYANDPVAIANALVEDMIRRAEPAMEPVP
ncbi:ATP-grasp domain-containing protein [Paracoccus sp. ME4]|uniref:ATP-grasp domain-containing protein n=1 Tax=Paracoccus sp. ME4 TaxID=3138066 RepID=UPI00398ABF97